MSAPSLPPIGQSTLKNLLCQAVHWCYECPNNDAQIREEMTLFSEAEEQWLPTVIAKAREIIAQQIDPWVKEQSTSEEE